ncbi:hypothetical protein EP47_04415 [Legionella norrlandica]|uniref:Uncharacterized protein n=1 Tax=Legionella norrlandica TaxID=1498499 RepID=A0A0A2SR33_9GAMM|nr:hypothetical protein [Legionella norrlandica]KGP63212.1 hypothetical protein EP47_04415 [Legionella norrlandica]
MTKKIVYLKNDPTKTLYYKDSVPRGIKTVEPDAGMMLKILAQKLELLEATDTDWLCCVISLELPENPVFYPTSEGITALYEKSNLTQWLAKKSGDPCGLNSKATIAKYVTPTPLQLLDFVIKASKIPEDIFVEHYKPIKKSASEEHLLDSHSNASQTEINNSSDSEKTSYRLLCLCSIFGCNTKRRKSQEVEKLTISNNILSGH